MTKKDKIKKILMAFSAQMMICDLKDYEDVEKMIDLFIEMLVKELEL